MNSLNVYLANYYTDKLNKSKQRREKNRVLFSNKILKGNDLTSKNAQTKIKNLEVNL